MTQPLTPATLDKPSCSSQGSACCASSSSSCSLSDASTAPTASDSEPSATPSRPDSEPSTNESGASVGMFATLRTLAIHRDNRGNVRETFRASWFPEVPPIKQLVRSKSKPQTLRGMHLHRKQWDIWHFVKGAALVRLYDTATGEDIYLWAGPGHTLAIPPGLSHGFYTPDGCILLYALTEEYDGSDEYGWHWSDGINLAAEFADEWPTDPSHLNISLRDLGAARLAEFPG